MKKYKTFFKLQWRMIWKTRSRFLSVLLIIFLGTAFFAGLRITPQVMNTSADRYLDNQNYADLTLIPTYGATDEDIAEILKIDGVQSATGVYVFDALASFDSYQDGVVVYSYQSDVNTPYLTDGRLPENDMECLVDLQYLNDHPEMELGDTVTLSNDQGEQTFTVVGFAKDVRQLIYYNRGTNTYGSGQSVGFVIINPTPAKALGLNQELIDLLGTDAFYNQVLIQVEGADALNVFSDEYDQLLEGVKADIEDCIQARLDERYDTLVGDKLALLEEPRKQYEEGLQAYENGVAQFEIETKQAEIALIESRMQILEGRQQLVDAKGQFTEGSSAITSEIDNLNSQLAALQSQLDELRHSINDQDSAPDLSEGDEIVVDGDATSEMTALIDEMDTAISEMNSTLSGLSQYVDAALQLESGELALDKAELQLEVGEQQLALTKQQTQDQLDAAKAELDAAKVQLDEAEAQINQIPQPTYYLLDKDLNEGTASFKSDSDRIGAIAELFPLTFFLVAALVSLTTMTRMVEEQRSQSGTLRALGYSKVAVMMQYICYALLATAIGSILGILFGSFFFPYIIYSLYCLMMYDVPQTMVYCWNVSIYALTIVIAVFVTLLATMFASYSELTLMPAILMRPKAPKLGKRILLEKVTWLWKRLNFNQKVTMRNIFRYKKRFFMSIIGIAGCTALIVTGFGVKYSITDMTERQFNEIWLYDGSVTYTDEYTLEEMNAKRDELKTNAQISDVMTALQLTGTGSGQSDKTLDMTLMVPSSLNRIDSYFTLREDGSQDEITLGDDGVVLSIKAAELLDVGVGDTIQFTYNDTSYTMTISAITENYMQHFIYMSSTYYASVFGEEAQYNACLFNTTESLDEDTANVLGKMLMNDESVSSVTFVHQLADQLNTQMESVDIVVWVLIISAALLAFVVLYNLTNININERISEIATIKVLGFRNKEVYDYVFRENTILSVIGTLIGLFLGVFLHHFIMNTVEVDMIMFVRTIRPISFVFAIVLTMMFTYLIDLFMRRVLRRIDMVSSLKSIE